MEPMNHDVIEIDVKELFYVLLHKFWIIISIGIIGAAAAWAVSTYVIKPVYTSTTKVYIINKADETKMTLQDLQTGSQLTKDYMILVKSRLVTEQVIKDLNLTMTSEELANSIEVKIPQDTRILEIVVTSHDPILAKEMADAIAEVSSNRMVSIMEIKKVNVLEEGNLPTAPSGPKVMRNTILGGLLGGILVSIVILTFHLLNDTIRTTEDIEKYLGLTTLGAVPIEEMNGRRKEFKEQRIKLSRSKRKAA
jgi:capsular polysaccharide biosynthesis protein